jgi:predicted nucleic acid-binding protein
MERRGLKKALTTDRHFEQANLIPMMLQEPAL